MPQKIHMRDFKNGFPIQENQGEISEVPVGSRIAKLLIIAAILIGVSCVGGPNTLYVDVGVAGCVLLALVLAALFSGFWKFPPFQAVWRSVRKG